MPRQRKELEDGGEGSEGSHHSVPKETGAPEADRVGIGTESDIVAQCPTQMTKLDFALERDSGLASSGDESSTQGDVLTPCSSESSRAFDTKAQKPDDAQNPIHKQNEAKRARLAALAELVIEKGLSLPPEQGFVSGTTGGCEHRKVEENVARALGKDNINTGIAKDMKYKGEGGQRHHACKKRHVLCGAHAHRATTNHGDPSLTRKEQLSLLDAKRSQMQRESDYELITHALSYPNNHIITPEGPQEGVTKTPTPLSALSHQLRLLFSLKCPQRRQEISGYVWANILFSSQFSAPDDYECVVRPNLNLFEFKIPWDDWRNVLSLVLVFACQKEGTLLALTFAETRENTEYVEALRLEGWSNFKLRYQLATLSAMTGMTTVIGVKLIDIPWLALSQRSTGEEIKNSTFEHGFVMGIGPEGIVLWQGWGRTEHDKSTEEFPSYGLDEWFNVGGDEVTNVEEGDMLLCILERFFNSTGTGWNFKRNRAYKQAFGIDMNYFCQETQQRKPLMDIFGACVNLWVLEDVKVEDVHKFKFLPSEVQRGSKESDRTMATNTEGILKPNVGLDGQEGADNDIFPMASVGRDSKGTVVNDTGDNLKASLGSDSEGMIANDTENNSKESFILDGEGTVANEAGNNLEANISLDGEETNATDEAKISKASVILGSEGSTADDAGDNLDASAGSDSEGTIPGDTGDNSAARISLDNDKALADDTEDNYTAGFGLESEEITADHVGDHLEESVALSGEEKVDHGADLEGAITNDTNNDFETGAGLDSEEKADFGVDLEESIVNDAEDSFEKAISEEELDQGANSQGTIANDTDIDFETGAGLDSEEKTYFGVDLEEPIVKDAEGSFEKAIILDGEENPDQGANSQGTIAKNMESNFEANVGIDGEEKPDQGANSQGTIANNMESNSEASINRDDEQKGDCGNDSKQTTPEDSEDTLKMSAGVHGKEGVGDDGITSTANVSLNCEQKADCGTDLKGEMAGETSDPFEHGIEGGNLWDDVSSNGVDDRRARSRSRTL